LSPTIPNEAADLLGRHQARPSRWTMTPSAASGAGRTTQPGSDAAGPAGATSPPARKTFSARHGSDAGVNRRGRLFVLRNESSALSAARTYALGWSSQARVPPKPLRHRTHLPVGPV